MSICSDGCCECSSVAAVMAIHDIEFCFAVPGAPITHVAEAAAVALPGFEWAVNEKVAIESALGLSFTGRRSAVMFKQNGLNVALDSLMNAAVHTIGAALLVIVADDLDSSRSTVLQDSRALAELMRTPLVEPTMEGDLDRCLVAAVELSEAQSVPVILRLTGPLPAGSRGDHRQLTAAVAAQPVTVDRAISQRLTKLGRVQHRRLVMSAPGPRAETLEAQQICAEHHETGIIAFGRSASRVDAGVCRLVLRRLGGDRQAEEISRFVREHRRLLVVEEPLPHVEARIRQFSPDGHRVIGRLTGHLPPEGPIGRDLVSAALTGEARQWNEVAVKPDVDTIYPPYHDTFNAISALRATGAFVAVDVGCAVNLCYPPYLASDVALSLGSAISVAAGAARDHRPAVAVIGDYAMLHTGLQSLLDVALRGLPVVVFVLVNGVQDKTGRQPLAPGVKDRDEAEVILQQVVQGLGAGIDIQSWDPAGMTAAENRSRMTGLLTAAPVVVLVPEADSK